MPKALLRWQNPQRQLQVNRYFILHGIGLSCSVVALNNILMRLFLFIVKDYMPFQDIYVSAFKNEIEYNQVLLQTAAALQTNKFIQVNKYNYIYFHPALI